MKTKPKDGLYYDLIRVPSGHIPAPKANLWSHLPIPVKEERYWDFYYCPFCGQPSFYKGVCRDCEMQFSGSNVVSNYYYKRRRREYFRKIKKRLQYLFLPFLIAIGEAWYVHSKIKHYWDYDKDDC